MILFIIIMAIILIALFIVFGVMLDLKNDPKTKREKGIYGIGLTLLTIIIGFTAYIITRTLIEGNIIW